MRDHYISLLMSHVVDYVLKADGQSMDMKIYIFVPYVITFLELDEKKFAKIHK